MGGARGRSAVRSVWYVTSSSCSAQGLVRSSSNNCPQSRFGSLVEADNPGSLRVLQKLGFSPVAEFDEDWPEAKGGGIRRNWRLEKDVVGAKSTDV